MLNVNTHVTDVIQLSDSLENSNTADLNTSVELPNDRQSSKSIKSNEVKGGTGDFFSKKKSTSKELKSEDNCNISRSVVAQHNTVESSWVVYKDSVCDITDYLNSNEHPGGSDIIKEYTGSDITNVFKEQGHSKYAEHLLNKQKIGTVNPEPFDNTINKTKKDIIEPTAHKGLDIIVSGIDFNKPLIYQIYNSTNSNYGNLINTHYITNETSRLFGPSFLEVFTRTPWWVIPLIWVPVSLTLFFYTMFKYNLPFERCFILYFFGVFVWTFAEYIVHRYIFHFPEDKLFENGLVRVIHFLLHGLHHLFPSDPLRLVMPPALFIMLCTPFYFLTYHLVSKSILHIIWSGVILGYVFYDMLHFINHHGDVRKILYLGYIKAYHLKHHFRQASRGFGVTNPFWDHVFGTTFD